VKLYSEPGIGTTVKLYLPRHLIAQGPVEAEPHEAPAVKGERAELVLVVEDDDVRAYSAELVRELG
jgi:hypothetical protein